MSRAWAQLAQLPKPEQRVIEPSGLMNRDWYLWAMRMDAFMREVQTIEIGDLADVDLTTPPADTEQLTFVDADSVWKAGAA